MKSLHLTLKVVSAGEKRHSLICEQLQMYSN